MSSIESRRNEVSGTESHRVRFRHDGHNRAVTFATRQAAESWQSVLDNLGPERALSLLDDERPTTTRTVADQVDHHIAHLTGVTEGTRRRYQTIADSAIRPTFGSVLIHDLTRDAVALWVNGQKAAPKTIRNRHGLLSSALASAVRDGLVPANVAKGVKLPKRDHTAEMVFLTPDEFNALLATIPEHYRALVTLLGLTGVRWGEATALTPSALDRGAHSAHIRQAWKHTDTGAMELGPPKSQRSRRTVAVPEPVFVALEPHLAGQKPNEIILRTPRGNPIRSGTFHNVVWQKAAKALEAQCGKKPRVHDLRHSWASWAIQRGVPLPVIQRQMGHESITTTVDTYGHLARSDYDPLLTMGSEVIPAPRPAIES